MSPKKTGKDSSPSRKARTSTKPSSSSDTPMAGNLPGGFDGSAMSSSFSAEEQRKFLLALVSRLAANKEPYRLAKFVVMGGKGEEPASEVWAVMDDWNTLEGPQILVYKFTAWEKTSLPSYNQMTWANFAHALQLTRVIGFKWLDEAETESFLTLEQFEDYN